MPAINVIRRKILQTLAAAPVACAPAIVRAESLRSRPITLICPFGAGGTFDIYLRTLAKAAQDAFGTPLIVENRAGAGGTRGAIALASRSANDDGHLVAAISTGVFRQPWLQSVGYDPIADLSYIIGLFSLEFGIAVREDSPIRSLKQFVETGKTRPGSLTYAAGDPNTTVPPYMTIFEKQTATKFRYIPYKSGSEMVIALLGGQIDAVIDSVGGMTSNLQAKKLRLLATLGDQRLKTWPDVPTAAQQGYDLHISAPIGLAAPRHVPQAIIGQLHDGFRSAMQSPDIQKALVSLGLVEWYRNSEQYSAYARQAYADSGKLLYDAGLIKELKVK